MSNDIRTSSSAKALAAPFPLPTLGEALGEVRLSVDRFCLLAGIESLAEMMEEDATAVCGARHRRHGARRGYRRGTAPSEIGYHGGKVKVHRPRVRDLDGREVSLPSWAALADPDLLRAWAMNLMVLTVSTRKYRRAVRLPEGELPGVRGDGTSKSAVSRRFVALSRKKMKAWLAADLSELDPLVIQIDGLAVGDHVLVAAIGVDGAGDKHVLAVVEGATGNTATVQALLDNLVGRGLDPPRRPQGVHQQGRRLYREARRPEAGGRQQGREPLTASAPSSTPDPPHLARSNADRASLRQDPGAARRSRTKR